MPSDLDILMEHVAEINTKKPTELTDHDLDILIAHQRHNRARRAAGYKPKKVTDTKSEVDVLKLLDIVPEKPKRIGTLRRL